MLGRCLEGVWRTYTNSKFTEKDKSDCVQAQTLYNGVTSGPPLKQNYTPEYEFGQDFVC